MERPTLLPGEIAHQAIEGQYVVLSYAVSYIGSVTTLELLHRRTGSRGWYNWSLLVGSAISMGSIAIWGMHFIGNRAIILDFGVESHQLIYSSSFTALSFFLPIIVLLCAYMFIGTSEDVSKVRVTVGGTVAGLAVVLMHYLGQFGISNYTSVYSIGHVVGSVIIALVASNVALIIFFVLRSQWAGTWWKRISLGFVLAGAVSGMHWLATLGTQYRLRNSALPTSTLDRKQTVIVVGTFCALTCACLLAYAIIIGAKARQLFTKVRKVTLSAVFFDAEGRIMVSTSGSLPTEVITDSLNSIVDQEFTREHPVFLWFYRVSYSWYGVKEFVSGMQQHLRTIDVKKSLQGQSDMSLVFREMLCVAAKKLSEQIRFPLEHIGVLYDEILRTGSSNRSQASTPMRASDVEKLKKFSSAKGRTLFVYREVTRDEVSKLQSHGYRFANLKVATDVIARSLQLPRDDLTEHFRSMRESAGAESILEPGIHVGCFAVRANIEGGFDVLVQNLQPNLIPSVQLPVRGLTDEMKHLIHSLNGITLSGVLGMLEIKLASSSSEDERDFIDQMRSSVRALVKAYPDSFWTDAVFSSTPIVLPCRSGNLDVDEHSTAQMFVFRTIVPIHQRDLSEGLGLSPFEFFNTQQRTFSTSRDHEVFARQIHAEFSGFTERHLRSPKPALLSPRLKGFVWPASKRPSTAEKTLVENPFANIMVSQAVDVHSAKTSLDIHELDPMRTTGAAVAVREIEEPTWVEDYFHVLMGKSSKPM